MAQINLLNINWNRVLISILTIIILILATSLFSECENNRTSLATIEAQNSEISTYKFKNGQLVTSQKTAILTEKQLKEQIVSKDKQLHELTKKFSEVKTVTKNVTITKIDSVDVPFEVKVPFDFERSDSIIDKHYNFNYLVNQNGLKIKNLVIPDSISIVTGSKRKWFLGKPTMTIDITHSNPNVKETSLQHYEVQEPKKWYQTDGAKMCGAVILYEIAKALILK